MRNIKYLSLIAGLFFLTSCFDDPGTDITWEGGTFVELDAATTPSGERSYAYLRLNDGTTYSSGMNVLLVSTSNRNGVTVNFTIDASSTAIEGVHYSVSGSSVTIPAGEFLGELPITILADNIEAGESWSIDVTITSADVEVGDRASASHNIAISCPSELDGTYDYSSTNLFSPGGSAAGPVTGSGTLGSTPTLGNYTVTDVSFGLFGEIWGDTPAVGPVLNDVCDAVQFSGTDQYGDSYTILTMSRSMDGVDLTIDWENTFAEGATTVLSRTDAKTWPAAINIQ